MSKKTLTLLLLTLAGLALFVYVLRTIEPAEIIMVLSKLSWWEMGLLTLSFAGYFCFVVLGERAVLKVLGYHIPFGKLFILQCIRYSVGYVTPFMNAGGEPVKIYLLHSQYMVTLAHATTAILIERTVRQVVGMVVIVIGIIYFLYYYPHNLLTQIALIVFVVVGGGLLTVFFYKAFDREGVFRFLLRITRLEKLAFFSRPKIKIFLHSIDDATSLFMVDHQKTFLLNVGYAVANCMFLLLQSWVALTIVGLPNSLISVLLVFTLTNVASVVPIPGSLGSFEGGASILFSYTIGSAGAGVVFALVMRIAGMAAAIPGFLFLPLSGIRFRDVFAGKKSVTPWGNPRGETSKTNNETSS